jgi:hypothetical protein
MGGLRDITPSRRGVLKAGLALAAPLFEAGPSAALCSLTGPGTIPPPGSVSG